MRKDKDHADLEKFVTVQEAALLLGVSDKNIHRRIQRGEIKATPIGGRYLILREDVLNFKPNFSGRKRTSVPQWHISPENNPLIVTIIEAELRVGASESSFVSALERVKRSKQHLFQGTIARYIFSEEREPRRVQFFFVWRQGIMPPASEIENELAALREALGPVLAWDGASHRTGRVWMHT
jgi:excisionase family DNA binding protein